MTEAPCLTIACKISFSGMLSISGPVISLVYLDSWWGSERGEERERERG